MQFYLFIRFHFNRKRNSSFTWFKHKILTSTSLEFDLAIFYKYFSILLNFIRFDWDFFFCIFDESILTNSMWNLSLRTWHRNLFWHFEWNWATWNIQKLISLRFRWCFVLCVPVLSILRLISLINWFLI